MPKRVDANQPEITNTLRSVGATVQCMHELGHGAPDLLVGYHGRNYVLEIKVPGGKLTPDEETWHDAWRGQKAVVENADQALRAIGAIR